jgi:hypothetical protein
MRSVGLVALLVVAPAIVAAQVNVPNALLSVTVRQKQDAELASGLHVMELSCLARRCSLTTVTLNQCYPTGDGTPGFVPKVQFSSTTDGGLSVSNEGRTLVVRQSGTDFAGKFDMTLRFEYAPPLKDGAATDLIGFSGALIKNSTILGKVLTTEYIPLPRQFQVVPLGCGALVPGVRAN